MDEGDFNAPVAIASLGAQSVAAGSIIGPVHVGDVVLSAAGQVSPGSVDTPLGTNNLPQPKSSVFTGRETELRQLRSAFEVDESAVVTQAMHGLGGVGKTALALHYAHTYRDKYTVVWWISAESPETIASGLASLAIRLNPVMSTSGATGTESSEWAIAWLQCHAGWLLVFDNVENPDIVSSVIGQTQNGHHLITSRVAVGWHGVASQIRLDILPIHDAVELITRISGVAGDAETKRHLAIELGFLPLAIEQAASYVRYNRVSCQRYLSLLRAVPVKVLSATVDVSGSAATINKTWHVTLQAIDASNPLAISILRILAWLGSEDLPRDVLYNLTEDDFDVDGALGLLSAYSMISLTSDAVSVHRLVQVVVRGSEKTPFSSVSHPQVKAALAIEKTINLEPETSFESWPVWRRLMPHIEALAYLVPVADAAAPVATILYYAARFLKGQNQLETALKYAQRCVEMAKAGDDSSGGPDYLSCMNVVGAILQSSGQLDESADIFRDLVDKSADKHGALHPFTLSMKNNLASTFQEAGMLPAAIAIFERVLKDREEVLPADDPATLTSRHNLGSAYRIAGNPRRAIPILQRATDERQSAFGKSNVSTLNSMFNLAIAHRDAGNVAPAIRLLKQVIEERENIFEPDDLTVIGVRRRLADIYRQIGNVKRAIPLYEQNLSSITRALGSDDGKVIEQGMPLAFAYQDVRQPEKAVPLLRRVLDWQESLHGASHPSTTMARNNLALAHFLAGEKGVAAPLFERSLADACRTLGDDHEVTRAIRKNFSDLRNGVPITGAGQFESVPRD
ncbi:FxSxx-COOH system tetratricopeptide repeat protein [Streptomyces sp. NPDC008141]|uniref:FxSxx-COOH system tetratricopeptide repeat protein n=1 Tax=Streptomyces sp. NPDC008141 TaxID=3364815 RepID=UPI0036E878F3